MVGAQTTGKDRKAALPGGAPLSPSSVTQHLTIQLCVSGFNKRELGRGIITSSISRSLEVSTNDDRQWGCNVSAAKEAQAIGAYENYTAVSVDYNCSRVSIGVEIILGCLASGGRSLPSQPLLDAGCGTGSYAAVLRRYAAAIDAVDLNPSMLAVAQA